MDMGHTKNKLTVFCCSDQEEKCNDKMPTFSQTLMALVCESKIVDITPLHHPEQ